MYFAQGILAVGVAYSSSNETASNASSEALLSFAWAAAASSSLELDEERDFLGLAAGSGFFSSGFGSSGLGSEEEEELDDTDFDFLAGF